MRVLLVTFLMLAVGISGCLSGNTNSDDGVDSIDPASLEPLTTATFEFGEFSSYRVQSFDGIDLHVDVQLPAGEGPFPLLLAYTPYSILDEELWGASEENDLDQYGLGLADRYVPFGYAVGVAHVRGTGESEGCLTVGGPEEGKDGYAIVEAMAAMSWSNGKVALMGTSYVGTTPIETAVNQPPHLTTIIPISAVTEWYKYYFENGEQRVNGSPPPGASYPDPLFWVAMGATPGPRTGTVDQDDLSCPAEMMQEYWLQDDYNAYWKARDHGGQAADIVTPMLFVQGFDDENVATSMIPDFYPEVTAEKRAWLMQVGHGVSSSKTAYFEYEHRWLDYWMLGKENGALYLPEVVVEDNRGQWRTEEAWPPQDNITARFWLTADNTLTPDVPALKGDLTWTDDGIGETEEQTEGISWHALRTSPLIEAVWVSGSPIVHLQATSDSTDTQFSVFLYDEAPDGTQTFITRGYLDARHRDSLEVGTDLQPGTSYDFEWELHPREHYVDAGHRIVMVLKSSDPYIIPDVIRATNSVHVGPDGSWLDLPVLDASLRTTGDDMTVVFPLLFEG